MILVSVGMLGFLGMRATYMYENFWRAKQIAGWMRSRGGLKMLERMGGGGIRGGLLCIFTKTSILRNGLGGFKILDKGVRWYHY